MENKDFKNISTFGGSKSTPNAIKANGYALLDNRALSSNIKPQEVYVNIAIKGPQSQKHDSVNNNSDSGNEYASAYDSPNNDGATSYHTISDSSESKYANTGANRKKLTRKMAKRVIWPDSVSDHIYDSPNNDGATSYHTISDSSESEYANTGANRKKLTRKMA